MGVPLNHLFSRDFPLGTPIYGTPHMVSGLHPFKDGDVSSCSRNKIWRCSNFDGSNNFLCLAKAEGGLLYHSSFTY